MPPEVRVGKLAFRRFFYDMGWSLERKVRRNGEEDGKDKYK